MVPTTVNPQTLKSELQNYDDQKKSFLINGFQFGFKLGCEGEPSHKIHQNHASIFKNKTVVHEKLKKEQLLGRIAGPYKQIPCNDFVCSPLGLVPKKNPGEFRIIHDLSFPKEQSVNSFIPQHNSTVQYESIDNVINLVRIFGSHCLMAKMDIEDGFRNIPIHPTDYHLLGFQWEGQYYYDKCLPMGASSSCQIFEKLSTALHWIMINKYKAAGMSHLIDDFFFIAPLTQTSAYKMSLHSKTCVVGSVFQSKNQRQFCQQLLLSYMISRLIPLRWKVGYRKINSNVYSCYCPLCPTGKKSHLKSCSP